MRIVITGALGHIGSRLIHTLPRSFPGAELLLLDNFQAERYCSLFNLPADGRYKFIEADIMSADLSPIFQGADCVIHLAAITNAAGSFQMAEKVEAVNFDGMVRVAQACRAVGAPLIFLSTTSVYGTQSTVVDEACPESELQPQSPYAAAKLKSEKLLQSWHAAEGFPMVILRFGTIFGISEGMRFHTAVNKFIFQAMTGQELTVWRTALHQKRPYLDLEDAVAALAFVIRTRLFDGEVYNVLTCNCTVDQIVGAIRHHRPDLRLKLVDTAIMNQLSYEVRNDKFKARGFVCSGDLERGVAETVAKLRGLDAFQPG